MNSPHLERLVQAGQLKAETIGERELARLLAMGERLLADSRNSNLSLEGRFLIAYDASYAFASAALRRLGYRSSSRYIAFQCLEHTAGLSPAQWRVLALCHERRNEATYEGTSRIDETLLANLIEIVEELRSRLPSHRVPS